MPFCTREPIRSWFLDKERIIIERALTMPMYDYQCLNCGKESLIVVTLKEHESGEVVCPACGAKKLQQLFSPFIAHTTKKS
jgi:putative FmdB family regulatory protein